MTQPVRAMLENLFDTFYEKFQDSTLAWDRMLAFVVATHCGPLMFEMEEEFDWMVADPNMLERVTKVYRPRLLGRDENDILGEMYLEKLVTKSDRFQMGKVYTPPSVAELMSAMMIEQTEQDH